MNPELIWWLDNNIWTWWQQLEVSNEALSQAMEQSRRWAQAAYRTSSNQALNWQVAKFLQYTLAHPKSEEIIKCISLFMTWPNTVLFGDFCIFLAPFMSEAADQFAINQIYNINYHIKANKSEYISYINKILNNTYMTDNVIKNEEITTMDKINFSRLDQTKLRFYVDYIIWVFWREDNTKQLQD